MTYIGVSNERLALQLVHSGYATWDELRDVSRQRITDALLRCPTEIKVSEWAQRRWIVRSILELAVATDAIAVLQQYFPGDLSALSFKALADAVQLVIDATCTEGDIGSSDHAMRTDRELRYSEESRGDLPHNVRGFLTKALEAQASGLTNAPRPMRRWTSNAAAA